MTSIASSSPFSISPDRKTTNFSSIQPHFRNMMPANFGISNCPVSDDIERRLQHILGLSEKMTLLLSTLIFTGWITAATALFPWTYDVDAFGGPDFWGLVHKEWRMCTAGLLQSPINIDPKSLLYDPHLTHIHVDDAQVEASFENIGQLPILTVNDTKFSVNITGGPAFPYKYRLEQIIIHFGRVDDGEKGSEHTVDRVRFPAEIQLLAYNVDLYQNFSQAMTQPRGLLAISVIIDLGSRTEMELRRLTVASQSITFKGQKTIMRRLRPAALLPRTTHYVTYDGSLTFPGCHETVTWVIMNNPVYITREDLQIWNEMQKSETKQAEPAYMTPSYRPLKSQHGRPLRTNINAAPKTQSSLSQCSTNIYTELGYRANPNRSRSITSKRSLPELDVYIDSLGHL